MGTERTAWHVLFGALVEERAPEGFEVRFEHVLTREPQKSDMLIVRRVSSDAAGEAQVLLRMWALLTRENVLEFKSWSRPIRRGDGARLLGYVAQHHAKHARRIEGSREVTMVLVVARRTRRLAEEAAALGWRFVALGGGYYRVNGSEYPGVLAVLREIGEAERDDLLRWFGGAKMDTASARRWVMKQSSQRRDAREDLTQLPGWDEVEASFLASLPPERRLAGLAPEERVAGLAPEEAVLVLPNEVLARLPESFLETLPPEVRAEVRRRLGR